VFAYLSGSYFARGVPTTFTQGSTTLCGAMYSFTAFTFGLASGQAPPAQSIQWTMDSGFLPALTTSFTRNNVAIAITNFADRVVIGGNPLALVYTRVAVTNHGTAAVTVPPGGSGPNLVRLTAVSDTVAAGQTVNNDFVAAVDRFGGTQAFPSTATRTAPAATLDTARATCCWSAGRRRCKGPIPTAPTGTSTAYGRRHGYGRSTWRRPTTPASSASSSTTPRPSSAPACAR